MILSEHLDAIAVKKLVQFVHELMQTYFRFVEQRVRLEVTKHRYTRHAIIVSPSSGLLMLSSILQKSTGDNTILVRSLDRFHRRLQAMNHLLPDVDFSRFCDVTSHIYLKQFNHSLTILPDMNWMVGGHNHWKIVFDCLNRAGTDIVSKAAKDRVTHYLEFLKRSLSGEVQNALLPFYHVLICFKWKKNVNKHGRKLSDTLTDTRQSLAAPRMTKQANNAQLPDLLQVAHQSMVDQTKSVLANLQVCPTPYYALFAAMCNAVVLEVFTTL